MKKGLYTFLIIIVITVGIFAPAIIPTQEVLAQSPEEASSDQECSGWYVSTWPLCIAYWSSVGLLNITSFIFKMSGQFLETTIDYTIVQMSSWVRDTGSLGSVITESWTAFRDLANIFFIFVLLYIGIRTILGMSTGQMQQMLVKLIIVALLINFSLFFTKVIIDISNVATLQFYNAAQSLFNEGSSSAQGGADIDGNNKVSFYEAVGQSFDLAGIRDVARARATGSASGPNAAALGTLLTESWPATLYLILASLFLIIASFVFVAVALLFVVRFVILLFLMILSPIAYVAAAIPGTAKWSSKWWGALTDACVWPVVYMMFFYVIAILLKTFSILPNQQAQRFANVISSNTDANTNVGALIFQFIILITFIIASVIVAKNAGASSSKMLNTAFGKMTFGMAGFVGRQTFGRGAYAISQRLQDSTFAKSSRLGQMTLGAVRNVAGSSFDLRSAPGVAPLAKTTGIDFGKTASKDGYSGFVKRTSEKDAKYGKSLGSTPVFANKEAKEAYYTLKDKTIPDKKKTIEDIGKQIAEAMLTGQSAKAETLRENRKNAVKELERYENNLKAFTANKNLGQSAQSAYAEFLEKPITAGAGKSALGGAAAGAVLGTIAAGPAGTIVGAGIGAGAGVIGQIAAKIRTQDSDKVTAKELRKKDNMQDWAKVTQKIIKDAGLSDEKESGDKKGDDKKVDSGGSTGSTTDSGTKKT